MIRIQNLFKAHTCAILNVAMMRDIDIVVIDTQAQTNCEKNNNQMLLANRVNYQLFVYNKELFARLKYTIEQCPLILFFSQKLEKMTL